MQIKFDLEKINCVLDILNTYTKTTVTLFDNAMNCVSSVGERRQFCDEMERIDALCAKCRSCDLEHATRAFEQKQVVTYCCHAGVMEAVAPIFADGDLVAYFMIGKFRDAEQTVSSPETVLQRVQEYDLPASKMLRYYYELPELTSAQISQAIYTMQMVIRQIVAECVRVEHREVFTKFSELVEKSYMKKLTVDDFCKYCGVSHGTLYKVIAEERDGKTLLQCLSERRIEAAKKLLLSTDKTLDAIAKECGMSDNTRMTRTFAEYEGVTPSEFRKAHKPTA